MNNLEEKDLYHGMPVTCEIDGVKITDAKISINHDGKMFICRNKKSDTRCYDKLGLKYSWAINFNELGCIINPSIKHLLPAIRKIEDGLVEGDVIVNGSSERVILGVCGKVIFVSSSNDFDEYYTGYTLEELIKDGWKLKQPEPIEEVDEQELVKIEKPFLELDGVEYSESTLRSLIKKATNN